MNSARYPLVLFAAVFVVLVWSAINPKEYYTWFLEVAPALAAGVILFATYKRFRLTDLTYTLIAIHCVILIIGGHYTYAENPLFDWIRDAFGLQRNYYDRLGHFAQGFVPAIIAREILIRLSPVPRSVWLNIFVVSVCLAASAFYEFIEWWVAILSGEAAEAFLGTQGDPWDTQWDMFLCFTGAVSALLFLSRAHDRALVTANKDVL